MGGLIVRPNGPAATKPLWLVQRLGTYTITVLGTLCSGTLIFLVRSRTYGNG